MGDQTLMTFGINDKTSTEDDFSAAHRPRVRTASNEHAA